jgi:hypothetical protein
MRLARSSEFSTELATVSVLRSPFGPSVSPVAHEVFALPLFPLNSRSQGCLSWPFAPLQSLTVLVPPPKAVLMAASSLAVSSPSASSRCWAAT